MRAASAKATGSMGVLPRVRPYLYLAPALALYTVFFLWPVLQLVQLSTVRWKGLGPKIFVGFENYRRFIFADPKAWLALQHNVMWVVGAVSLPVLVGLFLALLLVRSAPYGRLLFRAIYFLPQALSSIVVAAIWGGMYNADYGAVNGILRAMGLGALSRGWLGDMGLVLPALFIAWSWIHYGFCMVVFIAALQGIDEVYFDAAKVDGAGALRQVWHVALPFMRRSLATVILISCISAFEVFDVVFLMTTGGPAGASLVLSVHMYDNAFRYGDIGYGAAIAVALAVFVSLFSVVVLQVKQKLETH